MNYLPGLALNCDTPDLGYCIFKLHNFHLKIISILLLMT
jgi:hypothetical protein